MSKYRAKLPQLSKDPFITDGGIETTLIYLEGCELPSFAAFILFKTDAGRQVLRKYFRTYTDLANRYKIGLILESATWRANPDWATKLGYSSAELAEANRQAVELLQKMRYEREVPGARIVISGCIGPRGDGYQANKRMTAQEAQDYHRPQIETLGQAGADLISAITMNYVEEGLGVTRAAAAAKLPVVISFTVETDGRLPTGQSIEEAVMTVDRETNNAPAYYMLNCAHPTHFENAVDTTKPWARRLQGIRVNASRKSHAELDQSTDLDAGNPSELAGQCAALKNRWPALNILGGCCGTDGRHIEAMSKALLGKEAHI